MSLLTLTTELGHPFAVYINGKSHKCVFIRRRGHIAGKAVIDVKLNNGEAWIVGESDLRPCEADSQLFP
jgi:hypothetical protein